MAQLESCGPARRARSCAPAGAGRAAPPWRGRGPRAHEASAARPPHRRKTRTPKPPGTRVEPAATEAESSAKPASQELRQTPQRHGPRQRQTRRLRGRGRKSRRLRPSPRQTPSPPRWGLPRCPQGTMAGGPRSLPLRVCESRRPRAALGLGWRPAPARGAGACLACGPATRRRALSAAVCRAGAKRERRTRANRRALQGATPIERRRDSCLTQRRVPRQRRRAA